MTPPPLPSLPLSLTDSHDKYFRLSSLFSSKSRDLKVHLAYQMQSAEMANQEQVVTLELTGTQLPLDQQEPRYKGSHFYSGHRYNFCLVIITMLKDRQFITACLDPAVPG